jgi:hypothetical protein
MKHILILIALSSLISCQAIASRGRFLPETPSDITSDATVNITEGSTDQSQSDVYDITQPGYTPGGSDDPELNDPSQHTVGVGEDEVYVEEYEPEVIAYLNWDDTTEFYISAGDIVMLNITTLNECRWYFRFEEFGFCLIGRADDSSLDGIETYAFYCLSDATPGEYNLGAMCLDSTGQKVDMKSVMYHVTPPTNHTN